MNDGDLRTWVERTKRNTVDAVDRGKTPYLNGATLILMIDRLLTRIEALEVAASSSRPTPETETGKS